MSAAMFPIQMKLQLKPSEYPVTSQLLKDAKSARLRQKSWWNYAPGMLKLAAGVAVLGLETWRFHIQKSSVGLLGSLFWGTLALKGFAEFIETADSEPHSVDLLNLSIAENLLNTRFSAESVKGDLVKFINQVDTCAQNANGHLHALHALSKDLKNINLERADAWEIFNENLSRIQRECLAPYANHLRISENIPARETKETTAFTIIHDEFHKIGPLKKILHFVKRMSLFTSVVTAPLYLTFRTSFPVETIAAATSLTIVGMIGQSALSVLRERRLSKLRALLHPLAQLPSPLDNKITSLNDAKACLAKFKENKALFVELKKRLKVKDDFIPLIETAEKTLPTDPYYISTVQGLNDAWFSRRKSLIAAFRRAFGLTPLPS